MRVFQCPYGEFCSAVGEEYDEEYELAYGLCLSKDVEVEDGKTKVVMVWFREEEPQISTMVHEFYHAMKAVLGHAGVDDEEAEAYYLDYLIREHVECS